MNQLLFFQLCTSHTQPKRQADGFPAALRRFPLPAASGHQRQPGTCLDCHLIVSRHCVFRHRKRNPHAAVLPGNGADAPVLKGNEQIRKKTGFVSQIVFILRRIFPTGKIRGQQFHKIQFGRYRRALYGNGIALQKTPVLIIRRPENKLHCRPHPAPHRQSRSV